MLAPQRPARCLADPVPRGFADLLEWGVAHGDDDLPGLEETAFTKSEVLDLPPVRSSTEPMDIDSWDDAPPKGPWLPERYEFMRELGLGGMGRVILVRDLWIHRDVAMKILRERAVQLQRQFLRESRVQAMLQHPNIVPVYHRGTLDDGRPWYTMQEVRGQRLSDVLSRFHLVPESRRADGVDGWTLHRLVSTLAIVSRAMAFAHSKGVVHRDLKPSNIMIGEFGETLILDWGVALLLTADPLDEDSGLTGAPRTPTGSRAGTRGYWPPEQANGDKQLQGPKSDVYSLGAVLFHMLQGYPARDETRPLPHQLHGPATLRDLIGEAMRQDPMERPTAEDFAAELDRWLDGTRRREEALAVLEDGRELARAARRGWARALEARQEAERLRLDLNSFASEEAKRPVWDLEDKARALEAEAAVLDVKWTEVVRSSLNLFPTLDAAHIELAEAYYTQLTRARARHDHAATQTFEALLRAHDRGRYAAWLEGRAAISLITDPGDAAVTLFRFVERHRRLVPVEVSRHRTPLVELDVEAGSYLLRIEAEGCHSVDYPVFVDRLDHWDGVPPNATEPRPVYLPRQGELRPGEAYVPAGWCTLGDGDAADGLEPYRAWVDGFAIARPPVSFREYLAFIEALWADGQPDRALSLAPAEALASAGGTRSLFVRGDAGFALVPGVVHAWSLDHPVVLVNHEGARACAEWLGGRLPTEEEWEKAARGVDGRRYPWGDGFDPCFANMQRSRPQPQILPPASFPDDRSPYGVADMAGNVLDWCGNLYRQRPDTDPKRGWYGVRGGSFVARADNCRAGTRLACPADGRLTNMGFRVARSIGPKRA